MLLLCQHQCQFKELDILFSIASIYFCKKWPDYLRSQSRIITEHQRLTQTSKFDKYLSEAYTSRHWHKKDCVIHFQKSSEGLTSLQVSLVIQKQYIIASKLSNCSREVFLFPPFCLLSKEKFQKWLQFTVYVVYKVFRVVAGKSGQLIIAWVLLDQVIS